MKRLRLLLVVGIFLASFAGVSLTVSAQAPGTWVSGIMVVNQNTTEPANITVTFYWAEGQVKSGVAHIFTDTIPAGKTVSYYIPTHPKTATLPSNFIGSVVISSDQPVAANVNTQVPTGSGATPSNPNRVGTSLGVLEGSTKLYFPQAVKALAGWNSYLAVQNTSGTSTMATIRYYNASDGAEVTAAAQTLSISAYSSRVFNQLSNPNLPDSWIGSAVVTADQPLAGVGNFYNAGTSVATSAFQSYNAFGAGSTKLYVPRIVRHFYGYEGGLTIQNIGTANTDVTVNFLFAGKTYTHTVTALKPNASKVLYMGNPLTSLGTANGTGSAVVTSSGQPIVAIINEDNRTIGQGSTYNAVVDGEQTNFIVFSQVASRFYGYSGGVQVQNLGVASANLTITFSMPGKTDIVITRVVPAMQSISLFAPNLVTYAGFNGSVTVSADQPIAGIANSSYRKDVDPADGWLANYGDSLLTYNGINK